MLTPWSASTRATRATMPALSTPVTAHSIGVPGVPAGRGGPSPPRGREKTVTSFFQTSPRLRAIHSGTTSVPRSPTRRTVAHRLEDRVSGRDRSLVARAGGRGARVSPVDARRGRGRAEPVVDVHDHDAGRAGVEHAEERREATEMRAVADARRH